MGGNDTIQGGNGDNVIYGGTGNDFTDFSAGDKLQLKGTATQYRSEPRPSACLLAGVSTTIATRMAS